jgi:putative hydrolase of the HAD superfamily
VIRPRAILFDLDDTILAYGARPLVLIEVAQEFAAEIAPLGAEALGERLEEDFFTFWADPTNGHWRMQMSQARQMIVRDCFARLGAPQLTVALADRMAERFDLYREEQQKPFPRAEEVVETLKARGFKLALVTNGSREMQRRKIERFDLAKHFDHIQIEGEAGFGKPDLRAYRHAMQALGVEAHETWMIGDNLEWEVEAPQKLGIFAVWHDHAGRGLPAGTDVKPDLIVRNLAELLDAPALR